MPAGHDRNHHGGGDGGKVMGHTKAHPGGGPAKSPKHGQPATTHVKPKPGGPVNRAGREAKISPVNTPAHGHAGAGKAHAPHAPGGGTAPHTPAHNPTAAKGRPQKVLRKVSSEEQKRQMKKMNKGKPNPILRYFRNLMKHLSGNVDFALDEETKEKVEHLQLTKSHLIKLHNIFDSIDVGESGNIDCTEFLIYLDVIKSPFTDNVFTMIGLDPAGQCEFTHLVRMIAEYCMFTRDDILSFVFNRYDVDGSGTIDEHEFVDLATTVNAAAPMFPGNFAKALEEFDVNDDGLIDFDEFREMDKRFPLILFPAFRLQDAMQRACLGATEWQKIAEGVQKRRVVEEFKLTHGGQVPDDKTIKKLLQMGHH